MRHKVHLLFTWANELARHPAILDAIEDIIGPDILCWNVHLFAKDPDGTSYVSWHQDAAYWGLEPSDVAAQLNITTGNCAVLTHRALAALRALLDTEVSR